MLRLIPFLPSLVILLSASAHGKLVETDVPTFKFRARVVSFDGKIPSAQRAFSFRLSGVKKGASTKGDQWSNEITFDIDGVVANTKLYPNLYLKRYPLVVKLSVSPASSDISVAAQLRWFKMKNPDLRPGAEQPKEDTEGDGLQERAEETPDVRLSGDLFGSTLGILIYRDEAGLPAAKTMAEYNERYWNHLEGVAVPEALRPKRFPIVDRFIAGDHDRRALQDGIENLARAGFSAIMMPPSARHREILLKTGLRRTSWAVYNPPGYAFDHNPKITKEALRAWAQKQVEPYLKAGFEREDMAVFAMSDEPGWYFPSMLKSVNDNPTVRARFCDYLKAQDLSPKEVGHETWDAVRAIGRSKAVDLPSKRLFYWSMRFFAWDSARHFANSTRALEEAFYPGLPVLTNWNFFSGRFYFPGPFGNNPHKDSPDCAMGGHDWFEFGRLRGCTMLWTEDWFGDDRAWQWSYYCSKLNVAVRKGGVQFGGYVIPRTCGSREDGILQRILSLVGHGGKTIKYFVFGPEYNFPLNCYSFKSHLLPKMAEAHRMIGTAEELLWPGRRPKAEVAILQPRSALLWDAWGVPIPKGIFDATNVRPECHTVDYMAEIYGLYLALQHANVPVDWVEEEDLSAHGLRDLKVLYVTAPNLPVSAMKGLSKWVEAGGTLVTVTGTGAADRYNQPSKVFGRVTRIVESPRERTLVADARKLEPVAEGEGAVGNFEAVGLRGHLANKRGEALAKFKDGTPAIVEARRRKGQVVHFAWMPGMSYLASSSDTKDELPVRFSEPIRRWIAEPVKQAGVVPPVTVSVPMVETPLLLSSKGAAITLLNWTGEDQERVEFSVRVPFDVKSIRAIKAGELQSDREGRSVTFSLPLGAAEIVMLRP